MTHDELVEFAAEKAGIEIEWRGKTPVYSLGLFTLTSPDLFLKGLAVCKDRVEILVDDEYGMYVFIKRNKNNYASRVYDKPSEIPQKFWECWAEVEGGK